MSLLESTMSNWRRMAGNRRLFASCLLLFLLAMCVSFWIFFPAEVLQRRVVQEIVKQTGQQARGEGGELIFPPALEFDLRLYPEYPGLKPLTVNDLQLSPVWSTLFSSEPGINILGELASGTLAARIVSAGQSQLELNNLAIGALQADEAPYRLEGRLSGNLQAEQLAATAAKGDFLIRLNDTRLSGLARFGLPAELSLGFVQLNGKINQRRLSFERILLTEGVIEISGGGTLLVGDTPEQTRLNLNIRLHPTPSTPDSIRDLLGLSGIKPTADGSYLMRISGTAARPIFR